MTAAYFGQFLLKKGVIKNWQLVVAVRRQKRVNIQLGTRAIEAGLMTPFEVHKINMRQRQTDMRFGELAVVENILSQDQLRDLLAASRSEHLQLGEALIQMSALERSQLEALLDEFKSSLDTPSGKIADLYFDRKNSNVLEICTDVTVKMFLRMLHIDVRPTRCHSDAARVEPSDYVMTQRFTGSISGSIYLMFSESVLEKMVRTLLELDTSQSTRDLLDEGVEFINVVSGNICARLSAAGIEVELEPPGLFRGTKDDINLEAAADGKLFTLTPLSNPDEEIALAVIQDS